MSSKTVTAADLDAPGSYERRSRHVYWYGMLSCGAKAGHDKASCLLTPDHPPPHRELLGHLFPPVDEQGPKAGKDQG